MLATFKVKACNFVLFIVEGLNIRPHIVVKSGGRALLREGQVKDTHREPIQ